MVYSELVSADRGNAREPRSHDKKRPNGRRKASTQLAAREQAQPYRRGGTDEHPEPSGVRGLQWLGLRHAGQQGGFVGFSIAFGSYHLPTWQPIELFTGLLLLVAYAFTIGFWIVGAVLGGVIGSMAGTAG